MRKLNCIFSLCTSVKNIHTVVKLETFNKLVYTFTIILSLVSTNGISAQDLNTEWLRVFNEERAKENPDAVKVQELYTKYINSDSFVKTNDVSECKHWLRNPKTWGVDLKEFNKEQESLKEIYHTKYASKSSASKTASSLANNPEWIPVGPLYNKKLGNPTEYISFIAAVTVYKANPNILYCVTEPGEIYKSIDRGENWSNMTLNYDIASEYAGLKAIAVNPSNPNEVITAGDGVVYKSTNGGLNWVRKTALNAVGRCYQIFYHPSNFNTIYFAGNDGLYISYDGGETIIASSLQNVFRINLHPTNSNIIYAVTKVGANPGFYRSTDSGTTWQQLGLGNGWYTANSPDATLNRAHIGVSKAAPDVVYVLLNGNSKAGDNNFIGLFKSTDQGVTWNLTHDHLGSPYTTDNPNLTNGRSGLNEMAVSNQNADHVIVGAVTLFASYDGGSTFANRTNGSPYTVHFDTRHIYPDDEGIWICNDGGLTFTNDALQSHREMKILGVHSQDFWGFDVGWHKKTMIGGLYHNGVTAWSENFPERNFINIQGGEPSVGNVNPHDANIVYGKGNMIRLPDNINGNHSTIKNISKQHTQVSWVANNGKFVFHPNNYNTFYFGDNTNRNQLWKTENNGDSFSLVHTFNANSDLSVYEIEISSSNPDVMYVTLGAVFKNTPPELHKTVDGGITWTKLNTPIPSSSNTTYLITIDPENENNIWLAAHTGYYITAGKFFTGINGEQVYKSTNGGNTWQNMSTSTLNGEVCTDVVNVAGTNGGAYLFTQNSVYYRDNSMADWSIQNNGMPFYVETNFGKIWYKGGKLVIGTFGRGIWEADINTPMSRPVARIMVDKFSTPLVDNTGGCYTAESFTFDDHSFLRYEDGASNTWQWEFPTGYPTTSTKRSPDVTFLSTGIHTATLTVTDLYGNQSTTTLEVEVVGDPNSSVTPIAIIDTEPEQCGLSKGSITFKFTDNPNRINIDFSIDGGVSFPYTVLDNTGSFTIPDLSAGSYYASTRWGNGECPVNLGLTVISGSGPCNYDCNNDASGTAFIDDCGECSGGLTGRTPIMAELPEGFTYLADEGQTATLPGLSTVAYGARCGYYFLYGRSGSITINTTTFGGDPAPNVLKKGYYKLNDGIVDCNGIQDGMAYIDDCDVCSGSNTGITPNSTCSQDCNNEWGGTAYYDTCNICVGGNTDLTACSTLTDEIISISGPNVLVPGSNAQVTVEYSVSEQREIQVFLQDVAGNSNTIWSWVHEGLQTVNTGTDSLIFEFTIDGSLPTSIAEHRWGAFITTYPNGGFAGKIGDEYFIFDVDINETLDLKHKDFKSKINIYPNPTKDILNIVLGEKLNGLTAEIIDLSGRVLMRKQFIGNKNTLDLSSISNGVYILFTKEGSNVTSVNKIVVSH